MSTSNQFKLNIYVNYKGNCREAFQFYEKCFGGKITMMSTFKDLPDSSNIPEEQKDKILHARIEIGDTALMGADVSSAEPMRSAYITLSVPDEDETERIYRLLSEGGQIFMKMEKTFFANRFAMLRDKFGANWMILNENEQS
jgi:PhnB protein